MKMNASVLTLGVAAKEINSISKGIQALTPAVRQFSGAWVMLFVLRVMLFFVIGVNARKRSMIRTRLGSCKTLCDDATCLPDIGAAALEVASVYRYLLEIIPSGTLFKTSLLHILLRREVNEWEELAQDCALATDTEFRQLSQSVAAHL